MEEVWPNKKEDYELQDIIGHGATATVHSAICLPRQERCAIKIIVLEKADVSIDMFEKEIQAMNQCKHENVMNYYTSFVVKDELWVVMRLYNRGSMHNILKKRMETQDTKNGVLDEATIATVLREILKGLEYLHKNGQIHRDIKAGNILLDEDGSVVLADFGVSAYVSIGKGCSRDATRRTFVGTPCWMAPEVMDSSEGYDIKADIWSLGITTIELAVGMPPFYEMAPMKVLMTVLQNDSPTLEVCAKEKNQYKAYSKVFRRFINDCLQKSPLSRPSAKQLLKHDFFKKAKDKAHMRKLFLDEVIIVHPPRVKRPSGSSGKLHKNDQGEWVFSDDDEDDEDPMDTISEDAPGQNGQDGKFSNGTKNNAESSADSKMMESNSTPEREATSEADGPQLAEKLSPEEKGAEASEKSSSENPDDSAEKLPEEMNLSMAGDAATTEGEVLHMVLRIRDTERKLQDIKFDFTTGQDCYNTLAFDLVDAKLLDPKDVIVVASNIEKLVMRQATSNSIIFQLSSGIAADEVLSDKNLHGFALLSIANPPAPKNG